MAYHRQRDAIDDIADATIRDIERNGWQGCELDVQAPEVLAAAIEKDPDWHRDIRIMREEQRSEDREAERDEYER